MATTDDDPYLWLEDVEGDDALSWVRERNAQAERAVASDEPFSQLSKEILEVLDSDDRIPELAKAGEWYYNFWRDAEHVRGIWRRTTLESYRTDNPDWDVLLDIDALNDLEDTNWVWHGARILRTGPRAYERALVSLSRGGSDADVTREFDLVTRAFVGDGFHRPEAKGDVGWIDADTTYVSTDTGPGSMSKSGHPRIARRWRRGEPLADAEIVYEGAADDLMVVAYHDRTPGFERDWVVRAMTFYSAEDYLVGSDGSLTKIDIPDSAELSVKRDGMLVELRDDWVLGDRTYLAGSLLGIGFESFLAGAREFTLVFEPTPSTSLAGYAWTARRLVLTLLEDVRYRVEVVDPADWSRRDVPGVPELGSVQVRPVDSDESDQVWLTTTGFLQPPTLSLTGVADSDAEPERLKTSPAFFDASRSLVEQHFVASADGTRIPYFVVRPRDLALDGSAPTLVTGYGGFEISRTPEYSGAIGRAWIERGGVYVVANIRGGGEYGPAWHQAALRENRHRAYEDFAAVARDLVDRGITSPEHLGAMGGSNGGLLMGNMLTGYPDLFGAIVIRVPLLDMRRYHRMLAGALWVAEYGDPDTADWEFLQSFSPYHRFDPDRTYPPVLLTTSTRDDRVHPGHARKLAALMLEHGKDVTYWENIEGGHGGAATNAQVAQMTAMAYRFLWQRLVD
ncbi:prolyl oligopeptidase family serine peptidase [Solicola gregarius]|uniref:Prolyl oligopeptidase family serine peptidase n=1 Tax=Solicola gregarius TaxID=2908642 RepID=A0AA46TM01_9ACTN|nr:prolyl oligopeptidase family serine peptidase [Solicola gregarius]UYM07720.1 prolyl oligopeptidase family serine peptidase [Solicola gregarius]